MQSRSIHLAAWHGGLALLARGRATLKCGLRLGHGQLSKERWFLSGRTGGRWSKCLALTCRRGRGFRTMQSSSCAAVFARHRCIRLLRTERAGESESEWRAFIWPGTEEWTQTLLAG